MSDNPRANNPQRRLISTTLSALLVFCAINAWLTLAHPLLSDPTETAEHGWSYWSLKAMQQTPPGRTNIVLLGSSLVTAAMFECDATFTEKAPIDSCFYRHSHYFDHQMRCQFNRCYNTMDLAAPGQIPSDAYLTIKTALANGITPSVVIYGLAPRDFIDHTLQSPCETEAFHYFNHILDLQDCRAELFQSPLALLNWTLQRTVYLYGASSRLAVATNAAEALGLRLLLSNCTGESSNIMSRKASHHLLPTYQPFNIEPGTAVATALHGRGPYLDNIQDYKDRYKQPNGEAYDTQMRFLERLISLCQSHDIDVILVNMPITNQNAELLDRHWRQRYLGDLKHLCQRHNVAWLDQCEFDQYQSGDFRDSVHLNGFGGRKFVDRLVMRIAQRPEALRAILAAGTQEKRSMAASRTTNFSAGIQ